MVSGEMELEIWGGTGTRVRYYITLATIGVAAKQGPSIEVR